jgi:membrane protein DedA with SNARE-associated domain
VIDAFLDWLAGLPTPATYATLVLLSAVENVFPPVPADVAVALGAFLAQRGEISAPLLGVLCWLANVASAAGTYWLGRARGAQFFASGWPRQLLPPEALQALHDGYRRRGTLGIFVSRFLPGVRAAVPPFAGVAGLSPARAILPIAAASALWYAGLIAAGATLGLQWAAVRELVEKVTGGLGILGAVVAVALVVWLLRKRSATSSSRR